jgi:ribosomal protein L31E
MPNKLITINIRKYLSTQPRTKRRNKAIKLLKAQVSRLAKVKPEDVRISQSLNSLVFKRYSKDLNLVKLNVSVEKDRATVTPFEEKVEKKSDAKTEGARGATAKSAAETKK